MLKCLLPCLAALALTAARADVQRVAGSPAPDRIQPHLVVLSGDWLGRLPPTGAVNAPDFLATVSPRQHIALGLLAEGPHRREQLAHLRIRVQFAGTGATELTPTAVRDLKAEGADAVLAALRAAGIAEKDRAQLEQATSVVTLAVFQPAWSAPEAGTAEIAATVEGASPAPALAPVTLTVRPDAAWLQDAPMDRPTLGRFMTRYHAGLAPGQALLLFRSVVADGTLNAGPAEAYFATVYRENRDARAAAVRLCPRLDVPSQRALAWILRRAGVDERTLSPALAPAALRTVAALGDPRALPTFHDPVSVDAVREIGTQMDRCWAGWMATGDVSYLRPLVTLLDHAADYPSLVAWQQAHGGVKGLNAKVARGLAYQIAGWSIASFQRSDPLVADWLQYWAQDPGMSATVRREILALPTNPAFRRK